MLQEKNYIFKQKDLSGSRLRKTMSINVVVADRPDQYSLIHLIQAGLKLGGVQILRRRGQNSLLPW